MGENNNRVRLKKDECIEKNPKRTQNRRISKNFGGGIKYLPRIRYKENKDTTRRIWKKCTERKAEDGQSI